MQQIFQGCRLVCASFACLRGGKTEAGIVIDSLSTYAALPSPVPPVSQGPTVRTTFYLSHGGLIKKSYAALSLLVIIATGLADCAGAASPLVGGILTNVNYGNTATPAASATKEGKAYASSILGIVANGDASVATAKASGGITTVASVDHSAFSVLFM